ncbi:MAG: glucosyl-dolichyl phosphate glucuronosyltransferase [Acidobacteriota bacterium]|jgi:glycosyltransferase involved in cell wall biosynthesis
MDYSIIIPTHNRADELRETIRSIARLTVAGDWELLVVDNRSTDHTPAVVEAENATFPVPLRYLFEPEQGRYAALNTGIRAATGKIIATTDDDARVEPEWLTRASEGLERLGCDYVGGKVLPLWKGQPPDWLPHRPGPHWAVLALQDHGEKPLEFGVNGLPWPLGINTATRREAFDRIDLFDNRLGRKAGTLRNQAQREWHLRARAAGMRGFYVPGMVVHHVVESDRLNKQYFRRWYYWHGISRAILFTKLGVDMDSPDNSHLDFSKVPQIAGVPRFMYRTLATHARDLVRARLQGDAVAALEHELWLCFFAGIVKQRWAERKAVIPSPQVNLAESSRRLS